MTTPFGDLIMATTFPPSREADLVAWALNWSTLTVADPVAYGLDATQATDFRALYIAYNALYTACNDNGTRTPTKVQEKKTAKKTLVTEARRLIAIVQAFPGTTDAMRRDLDISIRDYEPTPVPVPEVSPSLEVTAVVGRTIKLKLSPSSGEGRAKPTGVMGATLYYAVGEDYPQELSGWIFKGNTTQMKVDATIPAEVPGGSKVWITAAWFNSKAQAGPACAPVETRIAGGLSQAA
ncbi:hypothetical protein OT109_14495 [Phycisphaeraceae bacterium D3-23]